MATFLQELNQDSLSSEVNKGGTKSLKPLFAKMLQLFLLFLTDLQLQ